MLDVLDEFTRESLAIRVRRKLSSIDVVDVLTDLFILCGIPTGRIATVPNPASPGRLDLRQGRCVASATQ